MIGAPARAFPPCLVCGARESTLLHAAVRDHHGMAREAHAFRACRDCGSAILDPQPDPASLPALYPEQYSFRREVPGRGRVLRLLAALEWRAFYLPLYRSRLAIVRRLTGLRSGRILEIGCGNGLLLSLLDGAGFDVEGVDTSEADVAYARDVLGLRVRCGRVEDLALAPAGFDAVLLFAVLEHVPDPCALLALMRRLVRPGGHVVVGVPVLDSLQARLLGPRWRAVTEAPRHLMLPTHDGMRRLLVRAGLRDVRAVAAPLAETAGIAVLSLLPAASSPASYGRSRGPAALARRAGAGLTLVPALALGLLERTRLGGGIAGGMVYAGQF